MLSFALNTKNGNKMVPFYNVLEVETILKVGWFKLQAKKLS